MMTSRTTYRLLAIIAAASAAVGSAAGLVPLAIVRPMSWGLLD
jgi:hypothetical protein